MIDEYINKKKLIYPLLVVIVIFIPLFFIYRLFFFGQMLTGDDPSMHAMNAMYHILFIPYSPFYLNIGYYPSLLQNIFGLIYYITNFNIVDIMRYFMFATFILGFIIYAAISYKIADGNILKGIFIFLVFSFSISPIIKTLRDGSYTHIFAAWFLLPLFIYLLLNHKLFSSTVTASLIFYAHNLTTFILFIVIGSFILSDFINNRLDKTNKNDLKFIFNIILITLLISSPAIILFYIPTIINLLYSGRTGFEISAFNFLYYPYLLTYITLFLGFFSSLVVFIFNKKKYVSLWLLGYLFLAQYPQFSERMVREMSIPLALSIGIVMYDFFNYIINRLLINYKSDRNSIGSFFNKSTMIKIICLVMLSLVIINNGLPMISSEGNPVTMYYYSNTKDNAYNFLKTNLNERDRVIVLRGMDIWTKVFLPYGSVYEVIAPQLGSSISVADSKVNDDLTYSLLNPFTSKALENFMKYNINYFVVSSPLKDRWYVSEDLMFNNELLTISYESSSSYKLVYVAHSNEEMVKIYQIVTH